MSKPRLEWKVGLFVFIGLVLLAALLIQFSKGTTFFRPTTHILLRAANVGGLKMRASVPIADVRRLVLNEETLTNLSRTVNNFSVVSDHAVTTVDNVNSLVQSNSPSVALAVSNLVVFSKEINEFATSFSGVLTSNTVEISS